MEDFPVIIICSSLSSTYYVLGAGPKHFVCIISETPPNFPRGRYYYYPIWQFEGAGDPGPGSGRAGIHHIQPVGPQPVGWVCLSRPFHHPEVTALCGSDALDCRITPPRPPGHPLGGPGAACFLLIGWDPASGGPTQPCLGTRQIVWIFQAPRPVPPSQNPTLAGRVGNL